MRINTFKAIRFKQDYWSSSNAKLFDNSDTTNKIQKTESIIEFLSDQINKGVARIDQSLGLYILKITDHVKSVISVVGEVDYNDKSIFFPNEETHHDKLEHYKKMFHRYKLQTNPILTFYKNGISIKAMVDDVLVTTPTISANINGVHYEMWYITNLKKIEEIKSNLQQVDKLYIADGHHRFSMFNNMNSKLSAKIVISVTDSDSILIKSCHRVILGSFDQNWIQKISKFANVERLTNLGNIENGITLVLKPGEIFLITLKNSSGNLYETIKNDIIKGSFGIRSYEDNVFPLPGNIKFSDTSKIFELYKNSSAIIFIPGIDILDFFNTIDSGRKLPPTSTWFEPKIVDGFVVRKF